MSEFLSEEWIVEYAAAGAALPELAGADAAIQYIVSEVPAGPEKKTPEKKTPEKKTPEKKTKVRWFEVIENGRVTQAQLGRHDDPDITITWKAPAAQALFAGELSGDASFMQGRTKVEGDYVRWLLGLRSWRTSAPVAAMRAALVG